MSPIESCEELTRGATRREVLTSTNRKNLQKIKQGILLLD